MHHRFRHHRPVVLTAVAVVSVTATACSGEDFAEGIIERGIEAEGGGNVDIDLSEGEFRVETEDGVIEMDTDADGNMVIRESSEDGENLAVFGSAELPDDWPSEVPLPASFQMDSASRMDTGLGVTFILGGTIVDSPFETLTAWVDGLLANGYTEIGRAGDATGLSVQLMSTEYSIGATLTDGDGLTTITLSSQT